MQKAPSTELIGEPVVLMFAEGAMPESSTRVRQMGTLLWEAPMPGKQKTHALPRLT